MTVVLDDMHNFGRPGYSFRGVRGYKYVFTSAAADSDEERLHLNGTCTGKYGSDDATRDADSAEVLSADFDALGLGESVNFVLRLDPKGSGWRGLIGGPSPLADGRRWQATFLPV